VASSRRDIDGLAFGAAGLIGLGAVLVLIRGSVSPAVIALILSCAVVVVGQVGGAVAGLGAAVAATLSFNFFHTRPYLSLRIHDADDVWTTATLLAVGLIAGAGGDLVSRWRHRAGRALDELAAIERVGEALADSPPVDVVQTASEMVRDLLGLDDCVFVSAGALPVGREVLGPHGALAAVRRRVFRGEGFELPPAGVAVPVRLGGEVIGYLHGVPRPDLGVSIDRRRAAVTIGAMLAAAISRRDISSRDISSRDISSRESSKRSS